MCEPSIRHFLQIPIATWRDLVLVILGAFSRWLMQSVAQKWALSSGLEKDQSLLYVYPISGPAENMGTAGTCIVWYISSIVAALAFSKIEEVLHSIELQNWHCTSSVGSKTLICTDLNNFAIRFKISDFEMLPICINEKFESLQRRTNSYFSVRFGNDSSSV